MKPKSEIWLCNVPDLQPDYAHTWLFETKAEQQKYFQEHGFLHFEKYSYLKEDNAIKVNINFDSIHGMNYVMYKNEFDKWYYCFIMKKEYINELTTKLYIKTDIIQTYMFDFDLLESFVDRCHVDRWDRLGRIIRHDEPEDLEFGEYEEFGPRTTLTQYDDNYLIFASNPLGMVDSRNVSQGPDGPTPGPPTPGPDPGEGPTTPTGGNWQQGIVSAQLVRFIKAKEGYASRPYLDKLASPNVWTVGYGVTKQGNEVPAYNYLANMSPAPERDCAKVLNYLINEHYGKVIIGKIKTILTEQKEFDAITSFAYNLGNGYADPDAQWAPTLWKIIKQYKAGQASGQQVIDQFGKYVYSGGVIQPGLVVRRKQEGEMFVNGVYAKEDIGIVNSNGVTTSQVMTENNGDGWLPS